MKMHAWVTVIAAVVGLNIGVAGAAEIRMLNSAAIKPVMDVAGPQFEKATGHRLVIRYELTPLVKSLADKGEPFDVIIANPPHIEDLIKNGKVTAASRADIARFGVGIGVRQGAAKPDIGSVDAFKQALLGASSVAYVGAGTSGAFVAKMLETIGVSSEVKPKLKPGSVAESLDAVARGDAQLVLMPIPLIRARQGVELAGPLPAELQDYIVMTAGVNSASSEASAAQALVKFLMAPEATPTVTAKGYERLKR